MWCPKHQKVHMTLSGKEVPFCGAHAGTGECDAPGSHLCGEPSEFMQAIFTIADWKKGA